VCCLTHRNRLHGRVTQWAQASDRSAPHLPQSIDVLVLMVWPVGGSVPVAWLTVNCAIVSVFFSSGGPKPSSALAA
jgi:hypothetical protein